MDNRDEVQEFLASRRARLTPEQAGLGAARGHRPVPGLRRGEVADLAGVSVEYYARLERGNLRTASEEVLAAVARALQLDEAEREHLFDLARGARAPQATRRRRPQVSEHLQHLLDAMTGAPAFVRNGRLDVLAANALARALYSPVVDRRPKPVNLAQFCFLDPWSRQFYPDWDDAADTTVALLRTEAGRDPYNRDLTALVGEMSTRSEDFRTRWAAHEVRLHRSGTKHFDHPAVGRLDLPFEAFAVASDPRLTLTAYAAAPGSPSADGLALLASWAATRAAPIYSGTGPSRMTAALVRFTPGARTNWHRHDVGQTLHVSEGVGLVGIRDGSVVRARAGDTVVCPPGEDHWHGAAADTFMSHFALLEANPDGSDPTTWLEPVTDDLDAAAQRH